jgi:hypothetical protein
MFINKYHKSIIQVDNTIKLSKKGVRLWILKP